MPCFNFIAYHSSHRSKIKLDQSRMQIWCFLTRQSNVSAYLHRLPKEIIHIWSLLRLIGLHAIQLQYIFPHMLQCSGNMHSCSVSWVPWLTSQHDWGPHQHVLLSLLHLWYFLYYFCGVTCMLCKFLLLLTEWLSINTFQDSKRLTTYDFMKIERLSSLDVFCSSVVPCF